MEHVGTGGWDLQIQQQMQPISKPSPLTLGLLRTGTVKKKKGNDKIPFTSCTAKNAYSCWRYNMTPHEKNGQLLCHSFPHPSSHSPIAHVLRFPKQLYNYISPSCMLCRPILQLPVPEVQNIYKCASTYCEGEKVVPQQPNSANWKVEALSKYIYNHR